MVDGHVLGGALENYGEEPIQPPSISPGASLNCRVQTYNKIIAIIEHLHCGENCRHDLI